MSRRQLGFVILLLALAGGAVAYVKLRTPASPVVAELPSPRMSPPAPSPVEVAPTPEPVANMSLRAPETVRAGAPFKVFWRGPGRRGDFVTIVEPNAPVESRGSFKAVDKDVVSLTAPIEPGPHEIRYVAGATPRILGKISINVLPIPVALTAPQYAILGSTVQVSWSGPNNPHDYLTIVPMGAAEEPDDRAETRLGSPLELNVPDTSGDAELRYVAGANHHVLARRPLTITLPITTLSAPEEAPAGSRIEVKWVGPDHPGDCVAIVPKGARDGELGNFTATAQGSPLKVLALIDAGPAELRYMTGRRHRVLARSEIDLTPITVNLKAPDQAAANSTVDVTWVGPAYEGDYVMIVHLPESGAVQRVDEVKRGSPTKVRTPKRAGPAEIRYINRQTRRVLARRPITIVPGDS